MYERLKETFGGKKKAPGIVGAASVQDQAEALFDEDRLYSICPERGKVLERYYASHARKLADWLAYLPAIPSAPQGIPLRGHWQQTLAMMSLKSLDGMPLNRWAVVHGAHKWDWHRATFLRALFAGLGPLYQHCEFTLAGEEINPILQSLNTRSTLHLTQRAKPLHWSPSMVEYTWALKATDLSVFDDLDKGVWRAVMDSWASDADPENPIVRSITTAWDNLILAYETRGVPVRQSLLPHIPPFGLHKRAPQSIRAVHISLSDVRSGQTTDVDALQPVNAVMDKEPTSKVEPETPIVLSKADINPDRLIQAVAQFYTTGDFTANCEGALLHGVPDRLGIVVPAIYKAIAEHTDSSPEQIQAVFEAQLLDEEESANRFTLVLTKPTGGKKKIKIRLGILKKQMLGEVLKAIPANPIIEVRPPKAEEA